MFFESPEKRAAEYLKIFPLLGTDTTITITREEIQVKLTEVVQKERDYIALKARVVASVKRL